MTLSGAVRWGAACLQRAGIDGPRLEAELLLGHTLGLGRAQLYARLDESVPPEGEEAYRALLERRRREPLAYILGRREFYGLDLLVSPAVLVPRPETELLVEEALAWARTRDGVPLSCSPDDAAAGRARVAAAHRLLIADIGTGCGALALALAAHLSGATIYATDISQVALELARRNAERLGLASGLHFIQGDLLSPLPEPVDLLVANLPYVPTPVLEELAPEVRDHEPRVALDGGPDGLALIDPFLARAPAYLRPAGAVLLEIGAGQGEAVAALARRSFLTAAVEVKPDWAGHSRLVVIGSTPPEFAP